MPLARHVLRVKRNPLGGAAAELSLLTINMGVLLAIVGQAWASPPQESLYQLPVRVHLIYSSHDTALSTSRTPVDVEQLLATANRIWRAADIEWTLESLRVDTVLTTPTYDSVIHGQRSSQWATLLSPFPTKTLLDNGWNVFLVGDGGRVFGGFFRQELQGVVLADRAFGIDLQADGRGGATLAHELGHSLGLTHQACDARHDIMANSCWDPTHVGTLTQQQIAQARGQAALGRPINYALP